MAMIKRVATEHLKLLVLIFMLGNGFNTVPANPPANHCESDLYPRLLNTQYRLVANIIMAAIHLLVVRMAVNMVEDRAVAAARAVKGSAFDAAHEAAAAAANGIAFFPAGWADLRFVRSLLLSGIFFSGKASFLAACALGDGYLYRSGCHNGHSASSPWDNSLTVLMMLMHSYSAWVAISKN
jgi:hypothetical protein